VGTHGVLLEKVTIVIIILHTYSKSLLGQANA